MWKINIVREHYCELTGVIVAVTVSVDNGDTQYLTIDEYNTLVKNRKENYGEESELEFLGKS
jgi:hypothetical protein